jgi:hypothetical protein
VLAAAAGSGVLVACASVSGTVKKEGPAAKATLGKLAQAAADLATRPRVEADTTDPGKLPAGDLHLASVDRTAANVLVTYLEDLTAPGELGNVTGRIGGTEVASECASFLEHETYPWSPASPANWERPVYADEVAKTLATCGRAKVAFVIRTTELALPGALGVDARRATGGSGADAGADAGARDAGTRDAGARRTTPTPLSTAAAKRLDAGSDAAADASAKSDSVWGPHPAGDSVPTSAVCGSVDVRCRFAGGYLKAEVHVYALEPFAHLGAFLFEAESGERVTFRTSASADDLERDFRRAVTEAFGAAVRKKFPSADVQGWP